MFLQVKSLTKYYGEGDNRVKVLDSICRNQLNMLYTPDATDNNKGSSISISQRFPNNPINISAYNDPRREDLIFQKNNLSHV